MLRIGIVAGESSGDLLAADLITSLKARLPNVHFEGIGGPHMQAAGCKILFSYKKLAIIGLLEVVSRYFELFGIRRKILKHFLNSRPDVFIGVDAPDFNLRLEYLLHRQGVKTVHYVSPSIWAWRSYRIKKIKNSIDLMLVLFPFEKDIYLKNNIPVRYLGHPLADKIEFHQDKYSSRKYLGISSEKKVVALMPGSRESELKKIFPLQLRAASICNQKRKDLIFITSVLSEETAVIVEEKFKDYPNIEHRIFINKTKEVLLSADVGLLTSGTVTLEAMLCGLPMAVAYKINWLSARIIRFMVKVSFAALPNLLAEKQVVKEFLQSDCKPNKMAEEVIRLLTKDESTFMKKIFNDIHHELRKGASTIAADEIITLLYKKT